MLLMLFGSRTSLRLDRVPYLHIPVLFFFPVFVVTDWPSGRLHFVAFFFCFFVFFCFFWSFFFFFLCECVCVCVFG